MSALGKDSEIYSYHCSLHQLVNALIEAIPYFEPSISIQNPQERLPLGRLVKCFLNVA